MQIRARANVVYVAAIPGTLSKRSDAWKAAVHAWRAWVRAAFPQKPARQRKRGIGKERRKKRRGSALSDSGRDEKWLALIFRAHRERRSSSFATVPLRAVTTHRIRLFPSGAQVQPPTTLSDPSLQAFPPANVPFHRRQHADTHIPI